MSYFKKNIESVIFLLQEDKKKIPYIYFLILIVSILDIVGIGLVGPIVGFILSEGQTNAEILNSFEYLNIINFSNDNLFLYLSIGLILVFFFKMLIGIYSIFVMQKFSLYRATSIVTTLTESALSAPYIEHVDKNNSEIISNIERYSYIFGSLMFQLLKTISDTTVILFLSIFMFLSSPILTTSIFAFCFSLGLIYAFVFKGRLFNYGEKSVAALQKLVKSIIEAMNGYKEIKTLSIEKYIRDEITQSSKDLSDAYIKQSVISAWPRLFLEFAFICLVVLALQIIYSLNIDFIKIAPLIVMFMYLAARMIPLFTNLMHLVFLFNFHMPAIRILEDSVKYSRHFDKETKKLHLPSFENIRFENISFSYNLKSTNEILNNVSFDINKNEIVGISGESGSGKSTLLNILLGFLKPNQGLIYYNGKEINDDINMIKSKIFYIPQDSFFIDDTIEKNIALGMRAADIDKELINFSIEKVGLKEFLQSQEKGSETIIGQNGVKISGGQKQRLSLARSFYHKRDIVILDESTNALDVKNEKRIIDEIKRLSVEKTFIIVSHQKTILAICDKILSINNGLLNVKHNNLKK